MQIEKKVEKIFEQKYPNYPYWDRLFFALVFSKLSCTKELRKENRKKSGRLTIVRAKVHFLLHARTMIKSMPCFWKGEDERVNFPRLRAILN